MPLPAPRRTSLAALASLALAAVALSPRAARAQEGGVYGSEDLSSAPRLLSPGATARLVARSYPQELRRASTGGTVQLEFVVGADGRVEPSSVEVVSAPVPALGAAAKAVAEKMEFVPGKKDGGPVRSLVRLPISYRP